MESAGINPKNPQGDYYLGLPDDAEPPRRHCSRNEFRKLLVATEIFRQHRPRNHQEISLDCFRLTFGGGSSCSMIHVRPNVRSFHGFSLV